MNGYIRSVFLFFISLLGLFGGFVRADDHLTNVPPPDSADELPTAFDWQFEREDRPVKATIDEIVQNSRLKLKLRNFYLSRVKQEADDPKAWAQGGSVEYKIGKVGGIFSFTAEYFGSFPLWAPDRHDGTLLLEPSQQEIDVLGILNPRITLAGQVISLYRQRYDLPFLNSQDNRMIPNTFEGYTIGQTKDESKTFQYVAGYINQFKSRNNDEFVSMSDGAGATAAETGTIIGGARYYFLPDLSLGAINLYTEDALNIAYTEGYYDMHWTEGEDGVVTVISGQYGDERSVGEDLVRGDDFSTTMWGIQQATSYQGFIFKLAYTSTDSGGIFRSPFGSYAGYNSVIVEDFNRAGEQSWQVGLSYDFKRVGIKGLTLATAYIGGNGAKDEKTKESLADKNETDVTIDYKISEGLLKSFWVRLRGGFVDEDGVGTTQDYRVIVNYEIPLWDPQKDK